MAAMESIPRAKMLVWGDILSADIPNAFERASLIMGRLFESIIS
jgi:hypothetical protein